MGKEYAIYSFSVHFAYSASSLEAQQPSHPPPPYGYYPLLLPAQMPEEETITMEPLVAQPKATLPPTPTATPSLRPSQSNDDPRLPGGWDACPRYLSHFGTCDGTEIDHHYPDGTLSHRRRVRVNVFNQVSYDHYIFIYL